VLGQSQPSAGRVIRLDDLLELQEITRLYGGGAAFSADGSLVAFTIQRPYHTKRLHSDGLPLADRSDMFVASTSDPRPVKVADGSGDGASFWAPCWSPDGRRLAMLSTRGDNVHLWVWESGSLRQVTDRAVDLFLTGAEDRPYLWISPTRVLLTVLPAGTKPNWFLGQTRAPQQAMADWSKAWKAAGVTASVLTSGIKPDFQMRSQSSLVEIDIELGRTRVLTEHTVRNIALSPDLKAVAYLRKIEGFQPQSDTPLPMNELFRDRAGRFRLEIVSTEGISLLARDTDALDVVPMSLRWAPDGQELAFLAYSTSGDRAAQLVRFVRSSGSLKTAAVGEINPIPLSNPALMAGRPQLEWTKSGWLVYATPRHDDVKRERTRARPDWWLVSEDGRLRSLTGSMSTAPNELFPASDRGIYVGLADGNLWRVSAEEQPQKLTTSPGKRITRVIWPQELRQLGHDGMPSVTGHNRMLVGAGDEIWAVDLTEARLMAISPPAPGAAVIAFSPGRSTTLFHQSDSTGLHVWLVPEPAKKVSLLYEGNAGLRDIVAGSTQKIAYKSLDGRDLEGWLLLPPRYQPGQKCPLIVFVYPNWIAGARPPPNLADITLISSLNMQIAAARGYAVLRPSIPLNVYEEADDPLLKLTSAVLPAVDKVIERGVADPDRVFVMGQSNGGYATYGLITQTNRFKAAVAMAGYSDLISGYGQPGINRYDDHAQELLTATQQPTLETVFHLGGPPWKDMGRYLRNSPIFYADRVQTPLMIIHGDLDGVPIEQAEEFFMALYRQGKRAEFVRYWGEGHVILSPPNIQDMWNRIFAWFEEFSSRSQEKR
jgi:dipeptidyl aminopeptidase/acylaminoacyl peptidase